MRFSSLRNSAFAPAHGDSPCVKLAVRQVEKPWGRNDLPVQFAPSDDRRIGEIWFEHPDAPDLPLLVKYLFTSERLSIQVHPNDLEARERGLARGKSECWYVLDAEPGATLGLGFKAPVTRDELRKAAVDGSIEQLMDWKPVLPGDFFYVPAGTVHAIGAGITLLELQQNSDATYRLYDYGRPRELHLDAGIAVSETRPYDMTNMRKAAGPTDAILLSGPLFSLVRASHPQAVPSSLSGRRRWVMPLDGTVSCQAGKAGPGECMLVQADVEISMSEGAVALIGAEGSI